MNTPKIIVCIIGAATLIAFAVIRRIRKYVKGRIIG